MQTNLEKERKSDRVLVLKPLDGKAKNSHGIVDPRLFKGDNNLHAIMDPMTTLWSMRYDVGTVPPTFHQKFTSFKKLYDFAYNYFKSRNIEIKEVRD